MLEEVLDGQPEERILRLIEETAQTIVDTADCAIGINAAQLVLMGLRAFRDDYEEHILRHRCLGSLKNPVPCVALCPAGVDIPGYIALVHAGRYADAVRLIRKDNPFPTACAYICEHPCEARCRPPDGGRRGEHPGAEAVRGGQRRGCAPARMRPAHGEEGGRHRRRPRRPLRRLLPWP